MSLRQLLRRVTYLISASLAACSGSASTSPRDTKPIASSDASCPVAVPGTSATVEDTDTGAALVFVTTGDVAEVRERARVMAKMHNDHHASMGALPTGSEGGGGHDMSAMGSGSSGHDMSAMGGGSGGHDMSAMGGGSSGHDMSAMGGGGILRISIHSQATASDIEGGARIVFAASGSDVRKLQTEFRTHAQHLSSGSCTMTEAQ